MISSQLINPKSIAVIGASEHQNKPGGMVVQNLINGGFKGVIYGVNPNPINIKGVKHKSNVGEIESVDLAIISIASKYSLAVIKALLEKGTKAFIIFSAGFSEAGEEGIKLEEEMVALINEYNATLIGPNCIGVINETYKGVFTTPVPDYDPMGCELISSSGATAVFIMEAAMQIGLKFSNVYSIGNAAQTGVEEILEYMDLNYVEGKSPNVKLLYLEEVKNPFKFLKHATSLIQKNCKIAAIKSGYSEAGGRAASSHTGALATSDVVIRALFKKAGIVYCSSRDELIAVAGVLQSQELKGENIAIITHAGGSAVMLTDALTTNGLSVPPLDEDKTEDLLKKLHPGSSAANPIDFLATGTAEQLGEIIDFCEDYDGIDGMVVVFGSSGLFNVKDVYQVLEAKMQTCKTPIYPVLPSVINAKEEILEFLAGGRVNFPDEVNLGNALAHVYNSKKYNFDKVTLPDMDIVTIREIVNASVNGYLNAQATKELLDAAGIESADQWTIYEEHQLDNIIEELQYPVVMKVLGPIHKTEVDGVRLNIINKKQVKATFKDLMKIQSANAVLIQQMKEGEELYCGAVKHGDFGHVVLCGLGGVFLELLNDTASALSPMSYEEVEAMVESLKSYPLIEGYRNQKGLNKEKFIDVIRRIGALVHIAPEISELDLNPLKAKGEEMVVVDARICIEK